ncbi:hypothetical protein SEEA5861_19675 [Salmonella enterica subsp. enterica serovar Agona str. 648586-1]|nr:hypothetical protein SEEA5861_19675 [Salmonella enterica subsp. enterica serovar Agona str. 648586-1]
MPFTFHIGNHSCQISEKYLRDIIDNKREHVFSTYEKFIDFFRNIFTSRSLISDYREIYNLLCQKKRASRYYEAFLATTIFEAR